jgi:hypothetical protein
MAPVEHPMVCGIGLGSTGLDIAKVYEGMSASTRNSSILENGLPHVLLGDAAAALGLTNGPAVACLIAGLAGPERLGAT